MCQHPYPAASYWQPFFHLLFVVLFLRINATSSHLHGFILFISVHMFIRPTYIATRNSPKLLEAVRFIPGFYGIWNMDFFRSANLGICLRTDTLLSLALELLVGLCPLLLMLLSYLVLHLYRLNFRPVVVVWKPFRVLLNFFNKTWSIKTSLVDAFCTFFFLCYAKFLAIAHDLLAPVKVHVLSLSSQDLHKSWRMLTSPILESTTYLMPSSLLL